MVADLLGAAVVPAGFCLDSAFGNRIFNWAFAGLLLTPFVLAAGLLGGRLGLSSLPRPARRERGA